MFFHVFPIKTSIQKGFSMAMLVITRWYMSIEGFPSQVSSPRTKATQAWVVWIEQASIVTIVYMYMVE